VTSAPSSRLAWIDDGYAVGQHILMFQTTPDAWLGGDARTTRFLKSSQLLGTLPAPLFLFLAGISFALVADKLIRKNLGPAAITRTMLRRGAEIFAFGLLFRLQEYLIAWDGAVVRFRRGRPNNVGHRLIQMRNFAASRQPCRERAPGTASVDSYQTMLSGTPQAVEWLHKRRWSALVAAVLPPRL
jgi:hypothetical protein